MRFFLILLLLTKFGGCLGQFITLRCSTNIAKIQVLDGFEESIATDETEPDEQQAPVFETRKELDYDSIRSVFMDRYFSVSLPLRDLKISSKFGLRRDPFDHSQMARHNGLDLSTPANTEVYSMFAGKVIKVSFDNRSGNFVTVQHGDYTISFCHLTKALVKSGDIVKPGDLIALSGNTGRSTGPHLHLTVRRKGNYVNPAIILNYILDVRTHALEEMRRII